MSVRTLRYNTMNQHITKSALASTNRDALAFLEVAQIYNTNQQRAIVNLVRSLKRVGLWSKMKAIYPFVGGTATSHKWNLKDPRDADAAFRLTFSGGWTHSSNGATPNGTNGYADTFLTPNSSLVVANVHASIYSRTAASKSFDQPLRAVSSGRDFQISPNINGAGLNFAAAGGGTEYVFTTNTASNGFFLMSRTSSSSLKGYRNTSVLGTNTTLGTYNLPTVKTYLGAANEVGSAINYSQLQLAFATIGDGLTDTDATNLYNIVDLYQKRLGRAV